MNKACEHGSCCFELARWEIETSKGGRCGRDSDNLTFCEKHVSKQLIDPNVTHISRVTDLGSGEEVPAQFSFEYYLDKEYYQPRNDFVQTIIPIVDKQQIFV